GRPASLAGRARRARPGPGRAPRGASDHAVGLRATAGQRAWRAMASPGGARSLRVRRVPLGWPVLDRRGAADAVARPRPAGLRRRADRATGPAVDPLQARGLGDARQSRASEAGRHAGPAPVLTTAR